MLDVRGHIEKISGEGAPHFVARRADGAVVAGRHWPADAYVGYAGALEALLTFIRGALGDGRLAGVAHRVDGVLTVTVPKKPEAKPKTIQVKVS